MLILEKSLLDCEIFMTKKFLPSCAFLSLMLNTEFLEAFFLEFRMCGLRRVRPFCMCFMNVLDLGFSWVLEINSHISELKKPISWAVSQMKANSLKSAIFFLLVNLRIISLIFLNWFPLSVLWLLSTRSVFVGLFVLHGNHHQSSHQNQHGPCPGVLGLVRGTTEWFGWEGDLEDAPVPAWPVWVPSLSQAMALRCSSTTGHAGAASAPLWLKNSRVMFTVLESEGKCRGLNCVHNSK